MVHGELKVKLWMSILELESFTVSELAEHADVAPEQTYGELAALQKKGLLSAEAIKSKAKHRPLNLYRFTRDENARQAFIDKHLTPLFRTSQGANAVRSSEAAYAHLLLDEIDTEIHELQGWAGHTVPREPLVPPIEHIAKLREKLESVRVRLEPIAAAPAPGGDRDLSLILSKASMPTYSIVPAPSVAIGPKRWQSLSKALNRIEFEFQRRSETLEAELSFTEILGNVLKRKAPPLEAVVSWVEEKWNDAANEVLRHMLSVLRNDLASLAHTRERDRGEQYCKLMASRAVRWSADLDLISLYLGRVTSDPERNQYNQLNISCLQGRTEDAFTEWCAWTDDHLQGSCLDLGTLRHPRYAGLAVAIFDNANLAAEGSREFQRMSGVGATISTASFEAVDFHTLNQTRTVPTLFDPESPFNVIELGESMAGYARPLFASGQLIQRLTVPGIPAVRLATVLLSIGLKQRDAWETAQSLDASKVLLVVCAAELRSLVDAYDSSRKPGSILKDARFYGGEFQLSSPRGRK